ncbi:hypothetical protein SGLAD_v1c05350 [Spiroplasma gladiatoris]|uniref:Transmembrane protein n=1 Tax=Spiroplasma gladiatoris TaxID=2143 RepID=A0A4P7AH23_9MOLU|nr:hypothetical protein [Spiroplasma gladiatoris]QBQ07734.1 hypothetical protein SGLAD_v1c05350 [Spiroplasma gladiatoris]
MSKLMVGIIFICLVSFFYIGSLIFVLIKINKLKKIEKTRFFKNKQLLITFYILSYLITPVLLGLLVGLITYIASLDSNNIPDSYFYGFQASYLIYVIYVLAIILIGTKLYKTMYIVEANNCYYFLDNVVISKENIVTITNNLKRSYLIISYNNNNFREAYQLKYSWKLKDFFDEK